jgi:hypothetical protein
MVYATCNLRRSVEKASLKRHHAARSGPVPRLWGMMGPCLACGANATLKSSRLSLSQSKILCVTATRRRQGSRVADASGDRVRMASAGPPSVSLVLIQARVSAKELTRRRGQGTRGQAGSTWRARPRSARPWWGGHGRGCRSAATWSPSCRKQPHMGFRQERCEQFSRSAHSVCLAAPGTSCTSDAHTPWSYPACASARARDNPVAA